MCTLFEKLTSACYLSASDDESRLKCSICAHIEHLLNARNGCLSHVPDYGVPDIQQVYRAAPSAIARFLKDLVCVIEKYEPRLNHIAIVSTSMHQDDFILLVQIRGQTYQNQQIALSAKFRANGSAYVG